MESARFTLSLRMLNGKLFNFDRPQDAEYDIELVAEVLAKKCRFSDHISRHYSVAEHCVHAHDLYPRNRKGALMHDSPEFIVGDLITPIKRRIEGYDEIEECVLRDMERRFDFVMPDALTFKLVDTLLFHIEETALYPGVERVYDVPVEIECWSPQEAKKRFLDAFYQHDIQRADALQDLPRCC